MEAISHAGTCLGILASDGIILAAEKKNVSKLLDHATDAEKIFKLDKCVARAGLFCALSLLLSPRLRRIAPLAASPSVSSAFLHQPRRLLCRRHYGRRQHPH